MKSAIIIGGGFGGLTTGALLAREGMDVTVIEKNHHIGESKIGRASCRERV